MGKNKIILFIFVLFSCVLISGCSNKDQIHNLMNNLCLDLGTECTEIKINNINRYSDNWITNYDSSSINISGWFTLHNKIQSYFKLHNWDSDLYNMADWMEWSLVWYSKDNISCQILWSWDLDENLDFSWSWNISINCFDKKQNKK